MSCLSLNDVPGSACDSAGLSPPEASPRRCRWWGPGAPDEEAPVDGASQRALAEYEALGTLENVSLPAAWPGLLGLYSATVGTMIGCWLENRVGS